MARRLTRKEIVQEDQIYTILSRVSNWVIGNRFQLLIGVMGLVLILLGTYLWQNYRTNSTLEMQGLFAEALDTYHASVKSPSSESDTSSKGEDQEPPTEYRFESEEERRLAASEAFMSISTAYPDTRLGFFSRYYLGLIHRQNKNTEEANQQLIWVIENSNDKDVRNFSRSALASIALDQENHEEALIHLQQILEEPTPQFPEQIVLMRIAKSHKALGNIDKALEHYKKITSEYPASSHATKAQDQIELLEPSIPPEV